MSEYIKIKNIEADSQVINKITFSDESTITQNNFCTVNSEQNITGKKNFKKPIDITTYFLNSGDIYNNPPFKSTVNEYSFIHANANEWNMYGSDYTNTSNVNTTSNMYIGHKNSMIVLGGIAGNSIQSDQYAPYVKPGISGKYSLGSPNYSWGNIYSSTSTILTSDEYLKGNIAPCDFGLSFINLLKPKSFVFKNGGKRKHYGLISQDVETVLKNILPVSDFVGHKTDSFAGYCWTSGREPNDNEIEKKKQQYIDKNTGELTETIEKIMQDPEFIEMRRGKYSLRYSEFISPLIKAVQEISVEINQLKGALASILSNIVTPTDI